MFRKIAMIVGAALICAPVSGEASPALAKVVGHIPALEFRQPAMLSPWQLVVMCLSLLALCLLAGMDRQ